MKIKLLNLFLFVFFGITYGQDSFDNGTTNKINEKNTGKIIFSKEEISASNKSEDKIITEYNAGENLYMRAYFAKSMLAKHAELVTKSKKKDIIEMRSYYINGKLIYCNIDDRKGVGALLNTSVHNKVEAIKKAKAENARKNVISVGNPLITDNKSEIVMEAEMIKVLKASPKVVFSPGNFNLKIKIDLYDKKQKKSLALMAEGEILITVGATKDWSNNVEVYKYAPKDIELENKMQKAVQSYVSNKNWKQKIKKVIITSDWWVTKNEYTGMPVKKFIKVIVFSKEPKGNCTEKEWLIYRQYEGGGNYSEAFYGQPIISDQIEVPCSCSE